MRLRKEYSSSSSDSYSSEVEISSGDELCSSDEEMQSPNKTDQKAMNLNFNQFPHLHHIAVPSQEAKWKETQKFWKTNCFFPAFKGESDKVILQRERAFREVWKEIDGMIQETVNEFNAGFYDQVVEFVRIRPQKCSEQKIPTGLLLDGSGGAAQDVWIDQLTFYLTEITPIVVKLKTQHCRSYESALLHLTTSVYNAWANHICEAGADGGMVGGWEDIPQLKQTSTSHISMFQEWYKKTHKQLRKMTGPKGHRKEVQLVVILESLGHVPTQVLYRLVKLLSIWDKGNTRTIKKRRVPRLSVTLLIAAADVLDVGTQFLPPHILEMLYTQEFRRENQNEVALIDSIMKNVLFSTNCPIAFGPPLLPRLMEWKTNSVLTFTRDLKLALVSHFNKPGSQIFQRISKDQDYSQLRKWYKSVARKELTKKQISKWRKEFNTARETFYKNFDTFFAWIQISTGLGRKVRRINLLSDLLTQDVTEIQYLEDVWNALKSDLASIFQTINKFAREFKDKSILHGAEKACENIKNILEEKRTADTEVKSCPEVNPDKLDARARLMRRSGRVQSIMEKRRERLGSGREGKVKHDKHIHRIREAVVEYFRGFVREHLPRLTRIPLHEVFMCTEDKCVSLSRHSSDKARLCRQLSSESYRGIDTLSLDLLYEQLREPNRMINVHDLCKSMTLGDSSEQALATFFQNLGSCNFIEISSKSKRRVDHIRREVWP